MTHVLLAGGTGYVGRHLTRELLRRGLRVTCLLRAPSGRETSEREGAETRIADLTDGEALAAALRGERFDAVFSCIASRSGAPADAWRVDHAANRNLLDVAGASGARHFVLLSAICVQRPRLAFQEAKLAFERTLVAAPITHSIVRPTAFFKSLSGQIERVRAGKPYLVFGDGRLTACTPIGAPDLARYLADCLEDRARRDAILPIGGPGPALTPLDQGELLFRLLGREPRIRRVPLPLLRSIVAALGVSAAISPPLRVAQPIRDKAELARIGLYYATESMLVWNEREARYDRDATPSFGSTTLEDHFRHVLRHGLAGHELGDQAVF